MSSLFGNAGGGAGMANAYGNSANAGAFPASISGIGSGLSGKVVDGVMTGVPAQTGAIGLAQAPSFGTGFGDFLSHMFSGGFGGASSQAPSGELRFPSGSNVSAPPMVSGSYGSGIPDMSGTYGSSGMQTSSGVGDMQGLSKMPINPGLGQAGIALSGRTGFNNMFGGGQGQGPQVDPIGYNSSNGGQLSF